MKVEPGDSVYFSPQEDLIKSKYIELVEDAIALYKERVAKTNEEIKKLESVRDKWSK